MIDVSKYKSAIGVSVAVQILVVLAAGMALDLGESLRIAVIAAVAYWLAVYFVIRRHGATPSRFALSIVRVGYIGLLAVSLVISVVVWSLLGAYDAHP